MQLPIIKPAEVVEEHAEVFQNLFENKKQYQHFQNYVTALIVLENKSLANISRCLIESADKTNLSRFFSQAPWQEEEINQKRISYMMEQTKGKRRTEKESCLIVDDTLCEHVGNLFEYVANHYEHSENRYTVAHSIVTSHYISGLVRFPLDFRIYRRYEEKTNWEEYVRKHFPERKIPMGKERQKFHKEVDEILLKDEEFRKLHQEFQTKIDLAVELIEKALEREVPFKIVLMDSWYLAEEIINLLTEKELDWVSLLKKNRKLETNSFILRDEQANIVKMTNPHIKVEELVPLIPKNSYSKVTIGEKNYWYFAINLRIPDLGKVRLVISFENETLEGTYAVLVSNRTDWSAKKLIETYLKRWPIETFYQDSKGHLGLDEYRMRKAEAIKKHWCLVFVAYSFLHLESLSTSLTRKKLPNNPIITIGEVCRQQGQFLIQDLILFSHKLLLKGKSVVEVFSSLFSKQLPFLTS